MSTRLHRSNFGQLRSRLEMGGLLIEDTQLVGSALLPRHEHDGGYVAVVLEGGYEQRGPSTFDFIDRLQADLNCKPFPTDGRILPAAGAAA
jgi:hypothetical protein